MRVYKGCLLNINRIRMNIIKMCHETKTASLGSSLSCVEILISVYRNINSCDRFILSKGHASAGLYAVLDEFMYFGEGTLKNVFQYADDSKAAKEKKYSNVLESYCKLDSKLSVHVQMIPGLVDWSTGSLGHGLPVACGMALAGKRVFVVMSDGELCEGSNWEGISYAGINHLKIITIIDCNRFRAYDRSETSDILETKFRAFGWNTTIVDGHNIKEISNVIINIKSYPFVVFANTIKGKGISFIENTLKSHYSTLTENEYDKAILEQTGEQI